MKTIPLDPIFDNPTFQNADSSAQLAIIKIVYKLCRKNKTSDFTVRDFRILSEVTDRTFYQHKDIITSVVESVMPEIVRIKLIKYKNAYKASKVHSKNALLRKEAGSNKQQFSDQNDNKAILTPVPPPLGKNQYHQGHFDPIAVKSAKEHNATSKKRMFYDKPKD